MNWIKYQPGLTDCSRGAWISQWVIREGTSFNEYVCIPSCWPILTSLIFFRQQNKQKCRPLCRVVAVISCSLTHTHIIKGHSKSIYHPWYNLNQHSRIFSQQANATVSCLDFLRWVWEIWVKKDKHIIEEYM